MDESKCKFVSIRGIVKSTVPILPNNVIYAVNHELSSLVMPNKPFVLITGNSDHTINLNSPDAKKILNNPNLIHWFSQNLNTEGTAKKCSHIPIGIDYHSLSPDEFNEDVWWWGYKQTPLLQEAQLIVIREETKLKPKIPKIYCNFLHTLHLPERAESLKKIKHTLLEIENDKLSRTTTWSNMAKYKFVLSPPGVGIDCHRTWEALALGCIPIVKSSCIDPVFEGLPVWIVNDWEEANNLENCPVKHTGELYKQMTRAYWVEKVFLMV